MGTLRNEMQYEINLLPYHTSGVRNWGLYFFLARSRVFFFSLVLLVFAFYFSVWCVSSFLAQKDTFSDLSQQRVSRGD